jgi:hypothetical protein
MTKGTIQFMLRVGGFNEIYKDSYALYLYGTYIYLVGGEYGNYISYYYYYYNMLHEWSELLHTFISVCSVHPYHA